MATPGDGASVAESVRTLPRKARDAVGAISARAAAIAVARSAPWVEGLTTTATDRERRARPASREATLDAGDALDTGGEVDARRLDAGSGPAANASLSPSTSWSKP